MKGVEGMNGPGKWNLQERNTNTTGLCRYISTSARLNEQMFHAEYAAVCHYVDRGATLSIRS